MADPVFELIKQEEQRQRETLMMIPSENYAYLEVREAMGSVLGNKYAEGYPGKRYYQGNKIVDQIEQLAIERAKELFGVPHANVQPYSGSPANTAVYFALMKPGETLMGLELSHGGHLTHGHSKVTFSGRYFCSVPYQIDTNLSKYFDFEKIKKQVLEVKPRVIIVGTTAFPRLLPWQEFAQIADAVSAYLVSDISHIAGLVAGGTHPSPVPYVDIVTTTTHKTLRGPRGAMIMVTKKGLVKDPELGKKIDKAVFPGLQGGPHLNTIAGIAVCLEKAKQPEFKKYARQIVANAQTLAKELINYDFELVTGGTDNHLLLIDLRNKKIEGKVAAVALEEAGIVVNANSIPNDPNPPFKPSGIRLGTPAITSMGMKETEMKKTAAWIKEALENVDNLDKLHQIAQKVKEFCASFPLQV